MTSVLTLRLDEADRSNRAAAGALLALQGVLVGLLLFGDYLALTVSRLATGSSGNWILFAAALQPLVILTALMVGNRTRRVPAGVLLGYVGLCAIAVAHAVPVWIDGNELTEYGSQKLVSLFVLLGPALACGLLLGCRDELTGARTMPWLSTPLLLLCGLAVATNPRLLTIEHFADPPVWFGVFVMPTHQPLAFCLTKAALLAFALDRGDRPGVAGRIARLGFVGGLLGLVLLTGARSYAVAMVAALAAMSLLRGRRLGMALVGGAVALALFQSYASDLVTERFDPTQMLESLAYREREQAWQAAWTTFLDHPLVGVGAGGFAQAVGWHERAYPHNLLLEVACEFGVAGICCLLVMLWPLLQGLAAQWQRRREPSTSAMFGVGMFVFAFGGALAVGDLIRNYFLFFAVGLCATSLATDGARR